MARRDNSARRELMRAIRTAMLIPRYYPVFGGAETQCRTLVRHLRARGDVQVPFVLTRRHHPDAARQELVDGVRVDRLGRPGITRWREYGFYARALWTLLRRRGDYDVLHCHATSIVGFVATVAGKLARRPVVLKLSSNGEFVSGLGNYSGTVQLDRTLRGRLRWPLARFMARHASVVALNEEGRTELSLADARRVHVIVNGIDTAHFRPPLPASRTELRARFGFAPDELVFVYTGRFVAVKGIDILVDAFRALHGAFTAPRVRLCLVGSGALQKQSVASAIEQGARDCGGAIHVMPPTADVLPILQAADAFVFPSRREGMPNSVLEAMAVELPCVLSDIAPHRELAEHNPDARCWLFESGNADALRDALAACVCEFADGRGATARLSPTFEMARVAERYASLYGSLVPRRAIDATPAEARA